MIHSRILVRIRIPYYEDPDSATGESFRDVIESVQWTCVTSRSMDWWCGNAYQPWASCSQPFVQRIYTA